MGSENALLRSGYEGCWVGGLFGGRESLVGVKTSVVAACAKAAGRAMGRRWYGRHVRHSWLEGCYKGCGSRYFALFSLGLDGASVMLGLPDMIRWRSTTSQG